MITAPTSVTAMQPLAPGSLRILHLSDTHLTGDGALHQGSTDTAAALDAGARLGGADPGRGARGGVRRRVRGRLAGSYTVLRERVGAWAERHGAALVAVPGNHDQREGFRQVLANGHVLGEGGRPLVHTLEYLPPTVPVAGQSVVAGRRIVTVDTSVPGAGYGMVADEALDRSAPHCPSRRTSARWSSCTTRRCPLRPRSTPHCSSGTPTPSPRWSAGRTSDWSSVATTTTTAAGTWTGVPVLVAPGVANDTDVVGAYDEESAHIDAGYLVVDVAADGSVWSTPVRVPRPDADPLAFHHDADTVRAIIAAAG